MSDGGPAIVGRADVVGSDETSFDVEAEADDAALLQAEPSPVSPTSPGGGAAEDNIRVFVRVRPPTEREGSATSREIVRVDTLQNIVSLRGEPPRSFAFDGVLGESATQEDVFRLFGMGVSDACLDGYNGSVYVYGQTGSGKTYTMQGPVASVQAMQSEDSRGLMCRILASIFGEVGRRHQEVGGVQYSCKCSYLEIYKEQITDLLEVGSTNLQVREDVGRGVYVERLSEHSVWTLSDALHVVSKGLHQRHVGATYMNELSSRSHAVFTLAMQATSTTSGGVTSTRVSRLNLIDLAGSERQSIESAAAPHESTRVKEAGAINRSLSALTNVIMSLSNVGQRRRNSSVGGSIPSASSGSNRRPFVRYRDSKLTFLLRDSLGGNSKTVIVACVSPSALCFGETSSTLKFAARAKRIHCAAVKNEEYSGTVEALMLEIKSLKQQLELLSTRGLLFGGPRDGTLSRDASLAELERSTALVPNARLEEHFEEEAEEQDFLMSSCGKDEIGRLYAPRRVRRLEILLAAPLDRERRSALRCQKLETFTQYLNGLLERKDRYFDALRDYFAFLVDSAAIEGCYSPEVTARLILLRQQLSSASNDRKFDPSMLKHLQGICEEDDESLPYVLETSSMGPESQNRSSTTSLSSNAAGNRGRRASQSQLRGSFGRLLRPVASASRFSGESSPHRSSSMLTIRSPFLGGGSSAWFPEETIDDEVEVLRIENRLLRRQLENHPELHRLTIENRLLREHLASREQQKALLSNEPSWTRGRRHQRRANDGLPSFEMDGPLMKTDRSLTRNPTKVDFHYSESDGSPKKVGVSVGATADMMTRSGKQLGARQFPGIADTTIISSSSSSGGESDGEEVPAISSGNGSCGGHAVKSDAIAFLPSMAREVEGLLRQKADLEEDLLRLGRNTRRSDHPKITNDAEVSKWTAEISRGTMEALRFAESILAKGKVDPCLLSGTGIVADVGGGEGHVLDGLDESIEEARDDTIEGLDERDIFYSLMRSLPPEGPLTLTRRSHSSTAPHLLRKSQQQRSSGGGMRLGFGGGSAPSMRPSEACGITLMRNRSTRHLQSIQEASEAPSAYEATREDFPAQASDLLQESIQYARSLCNQLELVGDRYRDMRANLKPLQEECARRREECRFLEAQCRRLDMHCRLLEDHAATHERGSRALDNRSQRCGSLNRPSPTASFSPTQPSNKPHGSRFQMWTGPPSEIGHASSGDSRSAARNSPASVAPSSSPSSMGPCGGIAVWHSASAASGAQQQTRHTVRNEVPSRGLLYAVSVQESQPPFVAAAGVVNSPDDLRRVWSAPQLPVPLDWISKPLSALEQRPTLRHGALLARGATSTGSLNLSQTVVAGPAALGGGIPVGTVSRFSQRVAGSRVF